MSKRKSDEQLQNEIHRHSETARDLSKQSHETHLSALNLTEPVEHRKAMQTVIELQRLSIEETKIVTRIQKTLINRQLKTIKEQKAEYLESK